MKLKIVAVIALTCLGFIGCDQAKNKPHAQLEQKLLLLEAKLETGVTFIEFQRLRSEVLVESRLHPLATADQKRALYEFETFANRLDESYKIDEPQFRQAFQQKWYPTVAKYSRQLREKL